MVFVYTVRQLDDSRFSSMKEIDEGYLRKSTVQDSKGFVPYGSIESLEK